MRLRPRAVGGGVDGAGTAVRRFPLPFLGSGAVPGLRDPSKLT